MLTNLSTPRNFAAGISDGIYVALLPWFPAGGLKKPEEPFTDPGDEVTIKGTHSFSPASFGFMEITLAPRKNQLNAKMIGELMGQQLDLNASVFAPGSTPAQHSLMKQLLNKPLIVLVKDCNICYQLGTSCSPAYIRHDFSTGTISDGKKGFAVTVQAFADSIIIYDGAIKLLEEYPEEGIPVFMNSVPINSSSIEDIRDAYVHAETMNITGIYNSLAAGSAVIGTYIDALGNYNSVFLETAYDSFMDFVAALENLAGSASEMFGTKLLFYGAVEHYVAIEIVPLIPQLPTSEDLLIDFDGGPLEDSDESNLLTAEA